ncbi:GAF and ANTAR domain-containing protein [Hoyosella subflava]|uniref:Response regulator receiver and ANTAR domain protein n=1 Tax=Hoyosella subflava (strain DSM 45089 / JCM 17490 / NBRC 109087 / DQS3-9A1) TaxID=443218 RepID=F6ENQ4_HOYSD|nr:GAF and ANTAR domain-containing protein [Hoyosella subflava]AEF42911.1 Response regulator receiver and ANTAR domain protein [Hoyosella subflava DQS3-9A1]
MNEEHGSSKLANALGALAVEMQARTSRDATLQAIVHGAVEVVPGVRWAGVSLIRGRQIVPEAPTDPVVAELDQLQSSLDEGPCMSALREHHTVRIDDLATDSRWPRFASAAFARGARSMLSFQLFVRAENFGALNLYADVPHAFTDESTAVGTVFAQHAAVALAGANQRVHSKAALDSRDVIGQAKGLLMHRNKISGLQAFELLVRASQDTQLKLTEVARWVVSEHEGQIKGSDPLLDESHWAGEAGRKQSPRSL